MIIGAVSLFVDYYDTFDKDNVKDDGPVIEKTVDGMKYFFHKEFTGKVDDADTKFLFVGSGAFNLVYKFTKNEKQYVIRIPIPVPNEMKEVQPNKADNPERVARIWSEGKIFNVETQVVSIEFAINGEVEKIETHIIPFVQFDLSKLTLSKLKDAMIAYFLGTGRVILDPLNGNIALDIALKFHILDRAFAVRRHPYIIMSQDYPSDIESEMEASAESIEYFDEMYPLYEGQWASDDWQKNPAKLEVVRIIKALLLMQELMFPSNIAEKILEPEKRNILFFFLSEFYNQLRIDEYKNSNLLSVKETLKVCADQPEKLVFLKQLIELILIRQDRKKIDRADVVCILDYHKNNREDLLFANDLTSLILNAKNIVLKKLSTRLLLQELRVLSRLNSIKPITQDVIDELVEIQNKAIKEPSYLEILSAWRGKHNPLLNPPKPIDFDCRFFVDRLHASDNEFAQLDPFRVS